MIAVGVMLGKIKIFGVSLGVTFVLFTGIVVGHFGFTVNDEVLHFIREFGLILFIFSIGLQVGPAMMVPSRSINSTFCLYEVFFVSISMSIFDKL